MDEAQRISELMSVINGYSDRIAIRLSEAAYETNAESRESLRAEVLLLLLELKSIVRNWLRTTLSDYTDEYSESASLSESDILEAASMTINQFQEDISKAFMSLESTVNRLTRGLGVAAAFLSISSLRKSKSRSHAYEKIKNSMVGILGTNGRIYKYDLSYYVGLVANTFLGRVQSDVAMKRSRLSGLDLIQISPNPSTIGDYCDLYKGKVFSISGTSSVYPPLSFAPNGGAPFHPWCHHTMKLFEDEGLSETQKKSLGFIPADFLQLGKDGGSVNEFQKLWVSQRKSLAR